MNIPFEHRQEGYPIQPFKDKYFSPMVKKHRDNFVNWE
jgi:hypothetical protein